MGVWERVRGWEGNGHRAEVAVLGAGWVAQGLVHRLERSPGMRPSLVLNRTVERAVHAYERVGVARGDILVSDDATRLSEAIAAGRPAVSQAAEVVADLPMIDVVIEATGSLDHAATVMLAALRSGKDVVSINAEVDATVGFLLHDVAHQSGAVYTISDGDQPGVLLRQAAFVEGMGFSVTAAVNCKRHLDLRQNPQTSAPYAARDGTSPAMTTATGDGTKMQIENAVVANVLGLPPDCRGMHGVPTTLDRALDDVLEAISRRGVVEYTLGGDFGAGVFVIGSTDEAELLARSMQFYKMGTGPDFLFFRPFHLVHLEVPVTVAQVVLDRLPVGRPSGPPVAEVVAVAKRDLAAGERLDGIGGFTCYGLIDTVAGAEGLLPIGLAEHARLSRPIPEDQPVPLDAVELEPSAPIVELRRRQDSLVAAATGAGADKGAATGVPAAPAPASAV